jgi:hypothetical protein
VLRGEQTGVAGATSASKTGRVAFEAVHKTLSPILSKMFGYKLALHQEHDTDDAPGQSGVVDGGADAAGASDATVGTSGAHESGAGESTVVRLCTTFWKDLDFPVVASAVQVAVTSGARPLAAAAGCAPEAWAPNPLYGEPVAGVRHVLQALGFGSSRLYIRWPKFHAAFKALKQDADTTRTTGARHKKAAGWLDEMLGLTPSLLQELAPPPKKKRQVPPKPQKPDATVLPGPTSSLVPDVTPPLEKKRSAPKTPKPPGTAVGLVPWLNGLARRDCAAHGQPLRDIPLLQDRSERLTNPETGRRKKARVCCLHPEWARQLDLPIDKGQQQQRGAQALADAMRQPLLRGLARALRKFAAAAKDVVCSGITATIEAAQTRGAEGAGSLPRDRRTLEQDGGDEEDDSSHSDIDSELEDDHSDFAPAADPEGEAYDARFMQSETESESDEEDIDDDDDL